MSEEQPQQVAEQPEAQEQVTDAQPDQAVQESEDQNFNGPRSRDHPSSQTILSLRMTEA